jgi:uncharacterized membrane protein YkvA (DUF1232 family)
MKKIEDMDVKDARKRFIIAMIMLALAVVYLVSPIDIIPDALFPAGYLEDIPLLVATAAYAGFAYWKLRKKESQT